MTQRPAVLEIAGDIKLAHTVFALPFALLGLLLGTRGTWPEPRLLLLVLAAMVLARSAAMGFNRYADRRLDASNPRTAGRALPAGRVSASAMLGFTALCGAGFMALAYLINPLCFWLSPLVLLLFALYSLSKRYTALAHGFLGLSLALAPLAAWLAARGALDADLPAVLWLAAAVLCWVAGFDILYSCQDVAHDQREGLHSVPAQLGIGAALLVARTLHVLMIAALALALWAAELGPLSWAGVGLVALLLVIEHRLVSAHDLSRVNAAFFTANGVVSLVFALFVGTDLLWR
ncbi:MAG: UbiA-like polyprenyltransferase [Planctomycetota bacterium]